MPIQINSFMGKFGFFARQHFSKLASDAYLRLQFRTRGEQQKAYINYFLHSDPVPMPNVVNIETINRCNSTCAFCTANVHAEKRPLRRMDEELYHSIIDQLADWGYQGHLTLYGNNEPWLDPRIVELHRYAREKLPDCFIFMSTNGLMLTLDQVRAIQPYINQLIINNYDMKYALHRNIQEIYDYVKAHPEEFKDLDIQIQMRYLQEVLTNRAGSAPNKKATEQAVCQFLYREGAGRCPGPNPKDVDGVFHGFFHMLGCRYFRGDKHPRFFFHPLQPLQRYFSIAFKASGFGARLPNASSEALAAVAAQLLCGANDLFLGLGRAGAGDEQWLLVVRAER